MEKYKKKLKIQNWISAATALIMIAVMLAGSSQCIRPSYANEHWAGF